MKIWFVLILIILILPIGWYMLQDDTIEYAEISVSWVHEETDIIITNNNTWEWRNVRIVLNERNSTEKYTYTKYSVSPGKVLSLTVWDFENEEGDMYKFRIAQPDYSVRIKIYCNDPNGKLHIFTGTYQ
jgi:tellurite resistance-related uncharacterized protein